MCIHIGRCWRKGRERYEGTEGNNWSKGQRMVCTSSELYIYLAMHVCQADFSMLVDSCRESKE